MLTHWQNGTGTGMPASTFSMATWPLWNAWGGTMMTKQYLSEHTAQAIYKRLGGWGQRTFTKVHLQYGSAHLNTFTIRVKFFVSPHWQRASNPRHTQKGARRFMVSAGINPTEFQLFSIKLPFFVSMMALNFSYSSTVTRVISSMQSETERCTDLS